MPPENALMLAPLGRGGLGEVYRAKDVKIGSRIDFLSTTTRLFLATGLGIVEDVPKGRALLQQGCSVGDQMACNSLRSLPN